MTVARNPAPRSISQRSEAIVLFEFLSDHFQPDTPTDTAEEIALLRLLGYLESSLVEPSARTICSSWRKLA